MVNSNKNKWKFYILSFTIPVLLMLFAYLSTGVFIDKSILVNDLQTQYINFLSYFRNSVFENGIFYSFSKDMGDNFFGVFSYYLASPLNLLTFFVSPENLEYAVSGIILLRFGLFSLAFSWFLSKQGVEKGYQRVVFSTIYALSSFIMLFSYHILWADAFILLPIIVVGQQQILKGKKATLFITSFTAILIINYYMGYMIGLFCLLYFIYDAIAHGQKVEIKQNFLRMAGATIISIGLAMCTLLPSFFSLLQGKFVMNGEYVADSGFTTFNILAAIPKLFVGGYDSVGNLSAPFIYCGGAMGLLVVGYFFLQDKTMREKLAAGLVLLAFGASLYITPLYKMWHMFAVTNAFPYRFTFIISFFMVFIGCKTFASYKHIDYKKYLPLCGILLFLVGALGVWYPVHIRNIKIAITTIVGLFTVGGMWLASNKQKKLALYLVAVVLMGDMALNATILTRENYAALGATTKDSFKIDYLEAKEVLPKENRNEFYRTVFIGDADTPNNAFKMVYNNYYYSFTSLPNIESESARLNIIHTARYEEIARSVFGVRYSIYENELTEYPSEYFPLIYTGDNKGKSVKRGEDASIFLSDYIQGVTGISVLKAEKLDKIALQEASRIATENGIKELYHKGNRIKGTLTAKENNTYAYTSIIYDEAWRIRVNGKKVKTQRLLENFICFNLDKGENVIEMAYYPKGVPTGVMVTAITLAGVIASMLAKKRRKKDDI